jgi:hypothetical protein
MQEVLERLIHIEREIHVYFHVVTFKSESEEDINENFLA